MHTFFLFSHFDFLKLKVTKNFAKVTFPCSDPLAPPSDHDPHFDDPEQPILCIKPGSSKSKSGVSRYRDFIGCLPINLSKRIMGK